MGRVKAASANVVGFPTRGCFPHRCIAALPQGFEVLGLGRRLKPENCRHANLGARIQSHLVRRNLPAPLTA